MKTTKQEQLAILQENFGRKDLSEGCEIKHHYTGEIFTVTKFKTTKCYHCVGENGLRRINLKYAEDNNIAHPLTLVDMLNILKKKGTYFYLEGNDLTLDDSGDEDKECIFLKINLSENLLTNQSEEVVNEIYDILINNK